MIWRERVEEQGFGLIPEVLTQAEIARLTEDLTQSGLQRSRAGVRHALGLAAVAALAQDPRLLEIARGILGKQALPFKATLFDKSSSANWLVVWHQDTALPIKERRETPGWGPWSLKEGIIYAHAPASALCRVLALRVHLDDSTADNGPLRILPKTHKLGVLSDDAIHELAAEVLAVECLAPQRGILAMRPLVVHASSKLHGGKPRRVLHIEYADSALIGGLELAIA